MNYFIDHIKSGDLRPLINSDDINVYIASQDDFDLIFHLMFHHEKNVASRALDAVEHITRKRPEFLAPHHRQLIELLIDHPGSDMKWHLVHFVTRLSLDENDFRRVWAKLRYWATNPNENKIVRGNSLESLYDLMGQRGGGAVRDDFKNIVRNIEQEHVPSLMAKIRKLRAEFKVQSLK